jgi:RNA polymerase sigma factor (sigma-70 family)
MTSAPLGRAEVSQVLERYGPLIRRWVRAVSRNGADADDAFHDVFLKLMKYGGAFRTLPSEPERHRWLKTLAVRVCLTRLARSRREPQLPAPPELPDRRRADPEALHDLREFWASLPKEARVIGVLYFEEGYSQEEVHELTGRGRPFLSKTIAEIRRKLERQD